MNAQDFRKIAGAGKGTAEYSPVALLLSSGYACFGHFNELLNEDLTDTIMILNAQLIELKSESQHNRPAVEDFREFLMEIVAAYDSGDESELPSREDLGKSVPLVAIPMKEIAIVYPVAHIVELLQRASGEGRKEEADAPKSTPTLFDLDKSEILTVLTTKLW